MIGAFGQFERSHPPAGRGLILLAIFLSLLGQPPRLARAAEPAQAPPKPAAEKAVADKEKRWGRLIPVPLPITAATTERVRRAVRKVLEQAQAAHARPAIILEFRVPPGQEEFGRGSEFGPAYELANFLSGDLLNQATTVAYVPRTIQGHAVLVALACDELIMAPEAEIGRAGVDTPTITPAIQAVYQEIASRRKTVPPDMALGLVDPSQEVWKVETEVGREYVTRDHLAELRKHRTVRVPERPLFTAGEPGRLSGREARELDFVSYLAHDRNDVAKALGLPPEGVREDPSLLGEWHAKRVSIKGPIRAELVNQTQRMIRDAVHQQNVNLICLWIDSAGGSPVDSMRLANFLAFDLDPSEVRTVAFIPNEARGDAAMIAMACDQVVMQPKAVLGGEGEYAFEADEIQQIRQAVRDELAPRKSRSWSLIAAMIDPKLTVFRYVHPDGTAYFSAEEVQQQLEPKKWVQGEQVTQAGKPFSVEGAQAVEYRLADDVVDNFAQFKQRMGLENDPALLEPGWADVLIALLARSEVAIILVVIGFIGLYLELHLPGIGVGAFVAAVCFLLFFWAMFLGGTAGWLEVLLFLAGIACLLLEIFVIPGFGIFGIGGGLLVIVSLILASQTFIVPHNEYQLAELRRTLMLLAGGALGTFVAVLLLNRYLPHAPMLSRVMLAPPSDEEAEQIDRRASLVHFDRQLIGCTGVTTTPLVPSGKARIGDRVLDVIAESGEALPRGAAVEVVEVHGNRILVRATGELS